MSDPSGKNPSESKLSAGQDRELSSDEADAFARQFKAIWDKSAKPDRSVAKSAPGDGGLARGVGAASVPAPVFIPRPQDITPRGLGPVSSLPPPPVSSAPSAAQKPPASDTSPAPHASAAAPAIEAPLPVAPAPNPAALGITAPTRSATASESGKPTSPGTHPIIKKTLLGLTPVLLPATPVESIESAPPVQKGATSAPAPTHAREVQKREPAFVPQPVLGAQETARPLPSPFAAAKSAADTGLDDDSYPQTRNVPKVAIAIAGVAALILLGFLLFSGPAAPREEGSKQPATLATEIGARTPTNPVNTLSAPAARPLPAAPSSNNDAPGSEARPEPKETPPQADAARQPRVKEKERRPPVARSNKRPGETKTAIPKAPPPSKSPAIVRDNPF